IQATPAASTSIVMAVLSIANGVVRYPVYTMLTSILLTTSVSRTLFAIFFTFDFFFSSRRRHTRSKRDWSSDVCSSDLPAFRLLRPGSHRLHPLHRCPVGRQPGGTLRRRFRGEPDARRHPARQEWLLGAAARPGAGRRPGPGRHREAARRMSYDPHDGAVAERLGAQIQESRFLTLNSGCSSSGAL